MRKRILGFAALAAASAVVLTGCSGGGGGEEGTGGDVDFTAEPTGTLSAWGFENADDVGTSPSFGPFTDSNVSCSTAS